MDLGMIIVILSSVIWIYALHVCLIKSGPKYATFIMILAFVFGIITGITIARFDDNKTNTQIDQTNNCSCICCENNVDAEGGE